MAWLFLIFSIVCFILFLISFRYIPQYTHLISAIGTLLIAIIFFTIANYSFTSSLSIKINDINSKTYSVTSYKEYKQLNDEINIKILFSAKDTYGTILVHEITPDRNTTVVSDYKVKPTTLTVEKNQYFNLLNCFVETKYTYTFW